MIFTVSTIYSQKLDNLNLVIDLLERYIDDVNVVCNVIPSGIEYKDGKLKYDPEKEKRDEKLPKDRVTMEIIKSIANSISDMIEFTVDVPSNYEEDKMPILDMKVWLNDEDEVEYMFYEKPMKSTLVINKQSALPENVKMKTLTQEVFRRLHNTRSTVMNKYKTEILNDFIIAGIRIKH